MKALLSEPWRVGLPANQPPSAIDIIEMLCNGLEWNIENYPDTMNVSDQEALQQARAFLAATRPQAPAEPAAQRIDCTRCDGRGYFDGGSECGRCNGHGFEPDAPTPVEPAAAWRDHDRAIEAKALATAHEISLMWGLDRSQFVERIQTAVIDAMRWLKGGLVEAQMRHALAVEPGNPANQADVDWSEFPAWLIDHHEGDTITEERLQQALQAMLASKGIEFEENDEGDVVRVQAHPAGAQGGEGSADSDPKGDGA